MHNIKLYHLGRIYYITLARYITQQHIVSVYGILSQYHSNQPPTPLLMITATISLLLHTSFQPPLVRESIPYSYFLMLQSDNEDFHSQAVKLRDHLLACGYNSTNVQSTYHRAAR